MKLTKKVKRRIVEMILENDEYKTSISVCSIVEMLILEGMWDARIDPVDAYTQVRDIIEVLVPIIEYKANETEEGFIYTPYPL